MTTIITTAGQADVMSGTFTAVGDVFTVPTLGTVQACGFNLNGTFVATFVIEGTVGGISWDPITAYTGAGAAVTSVTAATPAFVVPVGGFQAIRLRCTVFTSGSPNVVAVVNGGWVPPAPLATTTGVNAVVSGNGLTAATTTISPATPAAVVLKASSGRLYKLSVSNSGAAAVWVKAFNATSITIGTTANPIVNMLVPAGQKVDWEVPTLGDFFSGGIVYYVSGGIALNDTTAITANTVSVSARFI